LSIYRVGVIGLGTVGSGVVRLLRERREAIRSTTGADLELSVVADIDQGRAQALGLSEGLFVNDAEQVLARQDLDLVVELIGGLEPARFIVRQALATGRSVVTANKHLLAESYPELLAAAREGGADLYFEAAVAGGIPILKSMREGLAANDIQAVVGIVNGTCNYILTEMSKRGEQFDNVLAEAQRAGYAEESPELDVGGHDSAHKLAVLATLAFQRLYSLRDIYVEGIERVTPADIGYAAEMGYVIKLLAIGRRFDAGVELRVHPTLLRTYHPLAAVDGVFNAVVVETDTAGRLMFYGRGAGQDPTASAVVADIIDAATRRGKARSTVADLRAGEVCSMEQLTARYFIRFNAADRYRVLGTIATELGQHRVSIQQVIQMEKRPDGVVPVVMFTHPALEADVQRAIKLIDANDFILEPTALIRVSADDE